MTQITSLDKFRVPLGGQEIELQQVDYEAGGMSLLRTRIREKSRFTIFDIDPQTARTWGEGLLRWAEAQQACVGRDRSDAADLPGASVLPLEPL